MIRGSIEELELHSGLEGSTLIPRLHFEVIVSEPRSLPKGANWQESAQDTFTSEPSDGSRLRWWAVVYVSCHAVLVVPRNLGKTR